MKINLIFFSIGLFFFSVCLVTMFYIQSNLKTEYFESHYKIISIEHERRLNGRKDSVIIIKTENLPEFTQTVTRCHIDKSLIDKKLSGNFAKETNTKNKKVRIYLLIHKKGLCT